MMNNMATAEQLIRPIKPPQNFINRAEEKPAAKIAAQSTSLPEWFAQVDQVDVTMVSVRPETIEAPKLLGLKEAYLKNYAQTKSHNLMVARFAEFKTAALGALIAMLGVPSDEIENLQKKAVRDAIKQNKMLFEENEFNGELMSLIGASKKKMKAQNRVLGEIRNQLLIQARNLGLGDYYTRERILEIRLEQCNKILDKFKEEKVTLEYQAQRSPVEFGVN